MQKRDYIEPSLCIIAIRQSGMLMGSNDRMFGSMLGNSWRDNSKDAWSHNWEPEGGSTFGGWTDNGDSAWE
ncbi:MAG: hypothetical protein J6129_05430 [Bacteroidaceae bacterium]|nr:hypothetical protein [Bacteroidaceae bacterium]